MTGQSKAAYVPPQSEDAEIQLLGAMMRAPKACDAVLEVLEPDGEERFYSLKRGQVYRAIRAVHLSGAHPDAVTVTAWLEEQQKLEDAGGRMHVQELLALNLAVSNAAHHAKVVKDHWARREVIRALTVAHQKAWDGPAATDVLNDVEGELLTVRGKIDLGRRAIATAHDLAVDLDAQIKNPPPEPPGLSSPFSFFPKLVAQRVYVVAGYTGHGKTVCGVQFAMSAAKSGARVGYASLEMSADDLRDRIFASFGIPLNVLHSRRLGNAHKQVYEKALREFSTWQLEIIDDPEANAAALLRYQRRRRYDLLVVDHLHRIQFHGNPAYRRHQLEDEVRAITNLARIENVPILLLAQLRRSNDTRTPFPRPSLASLRETGVIEHEAWVVAFVWQEIDKKHQPVVDELGHGVAEWIVAKNRSGPTGHADLRFIKQHTRYVELAEERAA